jgi:hypothetical protein
LGSQLSHALRIERPFHRHIPRDPNGVISQSSVGSTLSVRLRRHSRRKSAARICAPLGAAAWGRRCSTGVAGSPGRRRKTRENTESRCAQRRTRLSAADARDPQSIVRLERFDASLDDHGVLFERLNAEYLHGFEDPRRNRRRACRSPRFIHRANRRRTERSKSSQKAAPNLVSWAKTSVGFVAIVGLTHNSQYRPRRHLWRPIFPVPIARRLLTTQHYLQSTRNQ